MAGALDAADILRVPFAHLALMLGKDMEFAVIRGRGGNESSQLKRYREHETEIVIGMFADQIHAARRVKDAYSFR
jgi:hypothetical protein